jgi:two-component system sensor histidine kinase PfeS
MPGRHSLLWKLAGVLALFCLLLVSAHIDLVRRIEAATARLSEPARLALGDYGRAAESVYRTQGAEGLSRFLTQLRLQEDVWAVAVDSQQHSLSSESLTDLEWQRLSFVRPLDGLMGRPGSRPTVYIPFDGDKYRLVMELPTRFDPRANLGLWTVLLQRVLPAGLAILLGLLLFRLFIAPLVILKRQANALSANDLSVRAGHQMTRRKDELGELARAFDHMAERLEASVTHQRRLLRDLSHELRTPLSRLRAAGERTEDEAALRSRLEREVDIMQRLVEDSLELAWLDSERPRFEVEPIRMTQLWCMLADDASFETDFSRDRLRCELDDRCVVSANLTSLARALENLLRNAIRHSPPHGEIVLSGRLINDGWHLTLTDQGLGVPSNHHDLIFEPFARLDSARPGDGGFGLGLSISRRAIELQGGRLWASNADTGGLAMHLILPATEAPVDLYSM